MTFRQIAIVAGLVVAASAMADTYVLRGSFNNWGADGDVALNDMGGGLYSATLTGLTVGSPIELKATTLDWSFNAPGDNLRTMPDANGNLTVNFFPSTSWADGFLPDNKPRVGYVDPLQFGWEVIGEFNGWSGPIGGLTNMGNGLYEGEFAIAPGTYQFKFRKAGDWDISIGDDFSNYGHNITMTATGPMTRFTLDLPNGRFKTEAVPEPASIVALSLGAAALIRRRRR